MVNEFLGRGWAFPIRLADDGTIGMAAYEEDIEQAIYIILFTSPGERMMQPDFGCGLNQFVFDAVSIQRIGMIESSIREALTRFEPRIDILNLRVDMDESEVEGRLNVTLSYRVRSTNNEFNKVYPFYLQEG